MAKARAPYNFVPLPLRATPAEPPPSGDRYHDAADRYSGHIDLAITTETPLYLRGTVGAADLAADTPAPGFFAPTGRPAIPGSSLRGMLRTLVEIVSSSALNTDTSADQRFAFRAVADAKSALSEEYRTRLGPVQAGYVRRSSNGLEVQPAVRLQGQQFWQVDFAVASQALGWNLEAQPFRRQRIQFVPTNEPCSKRSQIRCVRELTDAEKPQRSGYVWGRLIVSGYIEKKRHAWIMGEPDAATRPLVVSPEVAKDYESHWSDALRALHPTGQFPLLPTGEDAMPCFYTTSRRDGAAQVTAIGHTRWFRAIYRNGIDRAVPMAVRPDSHQWDLAQALFGRAGTEAGSWAGRIFAEDALLEGPVEEALLPVARRQILATPKLTTVQHYLEQPGGNAATLRHWDSPDATVRGHKLYWHRQGAPWKAEEATPGEAPASDAAADAERRALQPERIQPVAPKRRFLGRLRFENLTDIELGALLFVVQLPPDCRHRLGQGKPLGLGSVQLTATLHVDDRRARYGRLFSSATGNALAWAEPERTAGDGETFQRAFAGWVLSSAHGETPTPLAGDPLMAVWNQPRLRALRALLTWDTAPAVGKTSYMQLEPKNEFSGRPVLPNALEVIGWTDTPTGPMPAPSTPPNVPPSQLPQPARQPAPPARGTPAPVSTLEDLQRRFARTVAEERPKKRPARGDERAKREQEQFMRQLLGTPDKRKQEE
ncbi:MAG: TIGR03986 family type III CRISPR-associated RAMP protein [Chloroflexota bacterium]